MIGLLQCDHVREEFRHIAGDYDEMFRRWLPVEWRVYDVAGGETPRHPSECDGYVTTGSRSSVYDDEPWIHRFADAVRTLHDAEMPVLGVCFGHQMIAHALGGRVEKSLRGWGIGVHRFDIVRTEPWMQPAATTYSCLLSCQDQVETLPRDSVVLAKSEHCPVGMFRTGTLLGIQGHPEFTPDYAAALMRARTSLIGEDRVADGLATLESPTHPRLLASWAMTFLNDQ